MVQDLWETHYQILLIIFLKEFIELNVYMNMVIRNAEWNAKITSAFLNAQALKIM